MGNPNYTFLLPAYKALFLRDALHSILQQTFPSFKVIVSDDSSPEPIEEIVNEFDDPRIFYRRNPNNIGPERLAHHWNKLLKECDSEFVIIASDDDLYHPLFLEEIELLRQNHPDSNLLRTAAEVIGPDGAMIKQEHFGDSSLNTISFVKHLLSPDSVLCIGNYAFKRSALISLGGVIELPYAWKSDSATTIALSERGVACSSKVLFSFRMSGINISSHDFLDKKKARKKIEAIMSFYAWFSNNIDQETLAATNSHIKKRLEGELRSYYSTLSFFEFKKLFEILISEHWFLSARNLLSFLWGWIRSHLFKGS